MTSADVTLIQHIFPFKDGTIAVPKAKGNGGGGGGGLVRLMGPEPPSAPGGDTDDETELPSSPGGNTDDTDEDDPDDDNSDLVSIESGEGELDSLHSADIVPGDAPRDAPPSRSTRSNVDMTGMSNADMAGISIKKVIAEMKVVDHTADAIENHIARVMGVKKLKQGDPDWAPPPWMDIESIKDPAIRDRWSTPDRKEIEGIKNMECVEEVPHNTLTTEEQANVIGSLTPRQVKRSGKDKSRVVARGDQMVEGLHYKRSHSPTIMHVSLRFLFALACQLGLSIIGGDFSQAYINADLPRDEWYHMWPPKSARQYDESGNRLVWWVKKSLYGGKNAGRNWYLKLRKFLTETLKFTQCFCEPCIFFLHTASGGLIIIGIYVDDLVTLYSHESEMRDIYAKIGAEFDFTPQEPLVDICGIEVKQTAGCIILTLTAYIVKMAKNYLTEDERMVNVKTPCDDTLPGLVNIAIAQTDEIDLGLIRTFRALVGALLFAITTVRAEAAYSIGVLAKAMNKPTPELLLAAKRVLQYLYSTRELGIKYSRNENVDIHGCSDSDWGVKASISGYAFFMACAVISFLSKVQPTIAMSSAQAEIYAGSLAGLEGTFFISLYEQITGRDISPIDVGIDSKAAEALSKDFVSNSRVRHFERRQLKIRELVERGLINTLRVDTEDNVSDIFTKPLGYRRFEKLRKILLNMLPWVRRDAE